MAVFLIMAETETGEEVCVSEVLFSREEAEELLDNMVIPEEWRCVWILEPSPDRLW